MGREIKFRAWDTHRKQMVSNSYEHATGYADTKFHISLTIEGKIFEKSVYDNVLPEQVDKKRFILMQFTGLLDKNGKEIYDGDILNYPDKIVSSNDPKHRFRLVKWVEEEGKFTNAYIDGNTKTSGLTFCTGNSIKHFEIIGNIYENPELIK